MKSKKNNLTTQGLGLKTLGDWVHYAEKVLARATVYLGHGTDNYWDEAVHLVLGMLQIDLESDPVILKTSLTGEQGDVVFQAIKARVEQRIPTPYLTHEAYCLGLPFYVDQRVLIPRSPFAEWLEKSFVPWIEPELVQTVLEIGTGSGVLAIIAALYFPQASVDAVDIDENALAVAALNVERFELQKRVNLYHSDCYEALGDQQYDIIFSNPPYVSYAEMDTVPPEYLHEPRAALVAEEEGLAIVIKIMYGAQKHLTAHGILVVEVGNSEQALLARFPDVPFTWLIQERGGEGLFLLTKQQLDEIHEWK